MIWRMGFFLFGIWGPMPVTRRYGLPTPHGWYGRHGWYGWHGWWHGRHGRRHAVSWPQNAMRVGGKAQKILVFPVHGWQNPVEPEIYRKHVYNFWDILLIKQYLKWGLFLHVAGARPFLIITSYQPLAICHAKDDAAANDDAETQLAFSLACKRWDLPNDSRFRDQLPPIEQIRG